MPDGPFSLEFDEAAKEAFLAAYFDVVDAFVDHTGWPKESIGISNQALAQAMAEADRDIEAIRMRRKHASISAAKVAGVVTFRLTRWTPIHLQGQLLEDVGALKINALVAFATCLKHLLNADITRFPESVTQEFHYTLLRRHTNQETLGLAYDMLDFHLQRVAS